MGLAWRFIENVLDTDFSGDGKLTVHFDDGGSNEDSALSAYVFNQALFVVGYATQSTGTDFAMTKIILDFSVLSRHGLFAQPEWLSPKQQVEVWLMEESSHVSTPLFFSNPFLQHQFPV